MKIFNNIILLSVSSLLISCTAAKVDFSGSQLNNLKYLFTNAKDSNSMSLTTGQTSYIEFKSSDTITASIPIQIQYQVLSPENVDISLILENYVLEQTIQSGAKSFSIPVSVKSTLPFTTNAQIKVTISSEENTLDILPNEYKINILNPSALPPALTFNNLSYANSSNVVTFLVSGTCENISQFDLLVNSSPAHNVSCVGSIWTQIIDLSSLSDGNINLSINNPDGIPYASTVVVKDTTGPTISGIIDGNTHNSITESPLISWTGADVTSGVAKYEIALGTSISVQDKYPWTDIGLNSSKTLSGLSLTNNSTYYVQIRATDMAGNVGSSYPGDGFTIDTTAPVAVLGGNPSDPTNVSTYNFTVTGTGLTHYSYKIGLSGSTDCSVGTGYSAEVIVATPISGAASPGDNKICVVGKNSTNTWQSFASATSFVWTYDNVAPVLSISSPTSASYVNQGNVSNLAITTTCSENGVTVNFEARSVPNPLSFISGSITCSTNSATKNLNLSTLPEGAVDLKTSQTDAAGNIGYSNTVTVNKDVTPPSISGSVSLASAYSNSTSSSPGFTWPAGSDTGSGLLSYYFVIGTGGTGSSDIKGLTSTSSLLTTHAGVSGLSLTNTLYYVSVKVKDNAGNFSSYITGSWTVDNIPPNVTLTAPANSSYINSATNQISFGVSATCETGLMVTFTATSSVDSNFNTSSPVTCSGGSAASTLDVSGFPEGNIQFTAAQTDNAGNAGISSTHNVFKDTSAPTLSSFSPPPNFYNDLTRSPNLSWSPASDGSGSGINYYEVAMGTSLGGTEVQNWMNISNVTAYQFTGLGLTESTYYFPSVRVIDNAGNISSPLNGTPWKPDVTAPTAPGNIFDGDQFPSTTVSPLFTWDPSTDSLSGVSGYEIRIVDNSYIPVFAGWQPVSTTSHKFNPIPAVTLTNDAIYKLEIRAKDNAGNVSTSVYGDGWKVVPPGWKHESYLKAINATPSDFFGNSIAIDGDIVAVGAIYESSNQTTITNGPTAPSDSLSGNSGAVYVYKRTFDNTSKNYIWEQIAYIKAPNAEAGDSFGTSVAISNNVLAVGAKAESSNQTIITPSPSFDNSAPGAGAVYIFKRQTISPYNWVYESYIKASNAETGDNFGTYLSLDGNLLVVGVPYEDSNVTIITNGQTAASGDNTNSTSGAVYIYKYDGSIWQQNAYIKAANSEGGDYFGLSLSISGDTLVVGAPQEDSNQTFITNGPTASADNSVLQSGAAYVYKTTGTTWFQEAYLKAPNPDLTDYFGMSVAINADTIVIGSPQEDSNQITITNSSSASSDNSLPQSGAVYVFKRTGTTWFQEAYLKAPNSDSADLFGTGVAIHGDLIAVSSPQESSNQNIITHYPTAYSTDNSIASSGAIYVFKRTGTMWENMAFIKAPNNNMNSRFGGKPITGTCSSSAPCGNFIALNNNSLIVGNPIEDGSGNAIINATSFSTGNSNIDSGAAYIFKLDLPPPPPQ